jgi:fructose transport system ATP-binding protein
MSEPILQARGLVKRYGRVTAIDGADFDLLPGEVLAVVGDNGAGKSSLIKTLSGAVIPDEGEIKVDGKTVHFKSPLDARHFGIETVYQDLAVAPALDTATMRKEAQRILDELGINIKSISQPVETLSGGQRQGVAVARAAAFGTKAVIMDEPTAALGVAESGKVLDLIGRIRDRGLPVVLISHNMPHVFDIADRIHVHRLGKRVAVVSPKTHTMNQVVGLLTGALRLNENGEVEETAAATHVAGLK